LTITSQLIIIVTIEANNTMTTVDATQLPALTRWKRALTALAAVLRDPEKTDQVLVFSTYANAGTMPERIHYFLGHPDGARLYAERRTIDSHSIDLEALAQLPEGTLGRAYAEFLNVRNFTPDVFEGAPEDITDPAMAYVVQRLRQTHDLWHVVTGYETDPASEVALQAFTYGQLGAKSAGILALLGTLRGSQLKRDLVRDVVHAYRLGVAAEGLAVFPWEDHWATPLDEVRAMLNLPIENPAAKKLADEVRAVVAAMSAQGPVDGWMTAAATNPPRAAA
jgi:ubiquinone biosynthesis protein COQ4